MDLHEEIGGLVAPLLHRTLFVCVSEPVAAAEEILPHIPDHLRHLVAMEKSGVLLASGPFLEAGQVGLRRFTIEELQLNQGRISVQIDFSDQKGGLDSG